ncbi:MAG: hypothetical protein WCO58_00170 [bacterium]
MKTTTVTHCVIKGKLIFKYTPVKEKPIDEVISDQDFKKLNMQRFIIRKGSKAVRRQLDELPKF